MTVLLNILIAVLLFCTGIYQLWNGNWTEGLMLFSLILILHNAAGGYQAAANSVAIYRSVQALHIQFKAGIEALGNVLENIERKVKK